MADILAPSKAQVDDFWRRMDELPRMWVFRDKDTGKLYGPFNAEEVCMEYAENADIPNYEVVSMVHPDAVNNAIEQNHFAFQKPRTDG